MNASPPRSFRVSRERRDVDAVLGQDRRDSRDRALHVLGYEHDRVIVAGDLHGISVDLRHEHPPGAERRPIIVADRSPRSSVIRTVFGWTRSSPSVVFSNR